MHGERYRANRVCLGCFSERRKKHRAENKEKISLAFKRWYEKNKERRSAYCKGWQEKNSAYVKAKAKEFYEENKEKLLALKRVWAQKNRGRVVAYAAERGRLIGGQKIAAAYRDEISKIYAGRPAGFHVDHIVPLRGKSVCGLHVPWNLQYLPASENLSKKNRFDGA